MSVAVPAMLLAILAACGGGDGGESPLRFAASPSGGTQRATVDSYLKTLPGWGAFAQNKPDTLKDEKVATDPNQPERVGAQDYTCTKTTYSFTKTPEKIVMFSPDREVMWPGALIQGRSHKALGSLASLPIRQRAPLKVSIPSLASGGNFREVDSPDQASVSGAIGDMVGNATAADLAAPSSVAFTMSDYTNERAFGLKAGLSGKYLNFEASASADVSTAADERTVMVYFIEKMFEVVVEPPESPAAMFSDMFTMAKLQEQVDLGRIGADNVPVYVSNVVYGRIMAFTLTSTKSSAEIKAALSAAYKGTAVDSEGHVDMSYTTVMNGARIAIASLGGPSKATAAMIASLKWQDYFKENAALSTAYPISYTLRNLGDGSIASISEDTEYEVKECSPSVNAAFMRDSFEPVAGAAKGADLWLAADEDSDAVLTVTAGDATSLQSVFYGFEKVEQTNKAISVRHVYETDGVDVTRDVYQYQVGFVKAQHFLGNMTAWYGARISYWLKPDDTIRRSPALKSGDYCYQWGTYSWFTCVGSISGNDQWGFEEKRLLEPGIHSVWAYDDQSTAATLVLRGGSSREFEMQTLTYTQPDRPVTLSWARRELALSNDTSAGKLACAAGNEPYRGCWLFEGRPANSEEIKYVLAEVKELRLRASYLVTRNITTQNNVVHRDVPIGYVGGNFDEIKFEKPTP